MKKYTLIFDSVIKKQFLKLDKPIKNIFSNIFDKMEIMGPLSGVLIDSKLHLYEIKMKRPPLRIYFRHLIDTNELELFEFQMKTSVKKQKKTINKIRNKLSKS